MQIELLIVLCVLLGIFVFLGISFAIVFLLQRFALNKQYKLMTRFNYYNDNPIASNLRPITYLVEKNKELQPLLDYFDNLNKTYRMQMDDIKKQLFEITKYNKRIHIFKMWKYLKLVEKNLSIIKKEEESFKILNLDTYSYTDNTSDISIILSNILSDLNAFLRDHNLRKKFNSTNDSLEKTLGDIEKITKEINEKLMTIDIYSTHETFLNAFINIQKLYELTIDYYYIHRYRLLIKLMSNKLKETINQNAEYIISQNIKNEIDKIINNSKIDLENFNQALWKKDFDKAKKILSDQIISIDKCISDILVETKFQKLLEKTFNDFKSLVLVFVNKYNSSKFYKTYQKISSDFNDIEDVKDKVLKCSNEMKIIFEEINNLKKLLASKKIHSKDTIININNIYKKIIIFLNDNEKIHDLLVQKIETYYDTVYAIDNYLIALKFLLDFISENNINNNEMKYDISSKINVLTKYQKILLKTKNVDENITNELNQIDIFIQKIQNELLNYTAHKEIAKRLMLYFNRYINDEPSTISHCSELIVNEKYQEAIEEYIQLGNRIKKKNRS